MRERLKKLIRSGVSHSEQRCKDYGCFDYGDVADYLLDNGVIVLPCKVGDMVYVIEPCACYNDYSEYDKCHHRRTKATKWIDMVRVPKKHHTKCLKLFVRPFKIEYLNKVGKTVFLSREEAISKLQESCEKVTGGVED